MIHFTERSIRNRAHIALWYGLAFQAGAINAGGFLASRSFVSHVTGFGTTIGIKLAENRIFAAFELLTVPGCFLLGALASGLLVDRPKALGKKPKYSIVMGLIWILLMIVLVCGSLGWLGTFGEDLIDYRDLVSIATLCMACGLQNACITSATRGTIRTTHLTGILTDLGINLIKAKHLRKFSKERYKQILINRIRIGTFLSFSIGSAISAISHSRFEYSGFIVPVITSAIFFGIAFTAESRAAKRKPVPLLKEATSKAKAVLISQNRAV